MIADLIHDVYSEIAFQISGKRVVPSTETLLSLYQDSNSPSALHLTKQFIHYLFLRPEYLEAYRFEVGAEDGEYEEDFLERIQSIRAQRKTMKMIIQMEDLIEWGEIGVDGDDRDQDMAIK